MADTRCVTTRRQFIGTVAAASLPFWSAALAAAVRTQPPAESAHSSGVKHIERAILFNGRAGGTTWFHPRACMIPTDTGPLAFMTLQSITGSDVFGHVHFSTSADLGKSWATPQKIAALGRHPARNELTEGVCDVVPEYHPLTRTVLAIGHNVYYDKAGRLARPQLERYPVYVVRTPDGRFSHAAKLDWDDPRGTAIYTCGCAQRVTLPDGRVLIPISFAPQGQTARSVGSVLCAFDGRTLTIEQCGNELSNGIKRGLLEPTLAEHQGRFYMTIRAEDNRGYVTSSHDGLTWQPRRPWRWDDGEPLTMSTTQQRWLCHSEGLFLVYTRRAEKNVNVINATHIAMKYMKRWARYGRPLPVSIWEYTDNQGEA